MTTEFVRTEVTHDTIWDFKTLFVYDTVLVRERITVVLSPDSTEKTRTTVVEREHTRSSIALSEEKSVLESEVLSEEHSTDTQTNTSPSGTGGKRVKAFLWGAATGSLLAIVITIAVAFFVRSRKR